MIFRIMTDIYHSAFYDVGSYIIIVILAILTIKYNREDRRVRESHPEWYDGNGDIRKDS